MFDQIFKHDATIKRYLAAPLTQSRLRYLSHCASQGAKPATLRGLARAQTMAIRYLDVGEEGELSRAALAAAVDRWARRRTGRQGPVTAACPLPTKGL